MPSYKVLYFGVKGLGEPIRFLLSYGNVEFVDERLDEQSWKTIKPTTPFGQLPLLEVDGKRINQSTAICRYLAKQFGLAGKDDWEALEIDAIVDTINDFRSKMNAPHYEKNPEAKAQKEEAAREAVRFYVQRLDEQAKRNGGYLVGGKLSWADVLLVALLDMFNYRSGGDILTNAPNLQAVKENVLSQPGIKAWVAKRPKTEY